MAEERPCPYPESLPGIDIHRTMETLGICSPAFLRILKTFYKDSPAMIARIKEAWDKGDRDTAIRFLHSLKGAASGIGAIPLFRLAQETETCCREDEILPDISAAGLFKVKTALDTVRSSIRTLMDDNDMSPKRALSFAEESADPATLLPLLEDLVRALEFPELTELEMMTQRLDNLGGHPKIAELTDLLRGHDHDLARQTVLDLQTQLKG